ncbi:MAG TPA: hypothetical protein VKW08_07645 [Xanthobacteraceae bacterium]|jgi:hypothetical protein|nr:hypothetical protein [Xanthobacteraceae bacterium]
MTNDDDLEWELWLELTDDQQQAILDREMAAYQRKLDAMTVPQQIAHHRRRDLEGILENRRRLRDPKLCRIEVIDQIFRDHIRSAQLRLLKLRAWRSTGIYPGSA